MNLERAKQLKVGDVVHYPADRGSYGGHARVSYIDYTENTHSLLKEPFLWVNLERNGKSCGVWPSNRLG